MATEQAQAPPPNPPPTEGHQAPSGNQTPPKGFFSQAPVALSTVAGLVALGVSLLFQLAPSLAPDPGANVGAGVAVIAVERKATVRDWIDRAFTSEEQVRKRKEFH